MTEPFYHDNWETIYCGDCLEILPELRDLDGVITDPPYELGFMGKDWDNTGISFRPETWKAVKDTCKPGAMMLCFGGTRTWHRIAVAIEDAGWEIRDTLMWLHGMGYPKSYNIGKGIDKKFNKMNTKDYVVLSQEKPEVGKPDSSGRVVKDYTKGVTVSKDDNQFGGTNRGSVGVKQIPCWVPIYESNRKVIGKQPYTSQNIKGNAYGSERAKQRERIEVTITIPATPEAQLWDGYGTGLKPCWEPILLCMKPIEGSFVNNALKYGVAGLNIGGSRIGIEEITTHNVPGVDKFAHKYGGNLIPKTGDTTHQGRWPGNLIIDEEVAQEMDEFSRYFYTAKASKAERDAWIEGMPETTKVWNGKSDKSCENMNSLQERWTTKIKNDHATVKPISLMKYLCNLIKPPTGGVLIDPFMGSGSSLIACQDLGIQSIGIDLSKHNCELAVKRLIHKPLL